MLNPIFIVIRWFPYLTTIVGHVRFLDIKHFMIYSFIVIYIYIGPNVHEIDNHRYTIRPFRIGPLLLVLYFLTLFVLDLKNKNKNILLFTYLIICIWFKKIICIWSTKANNLITRIQHIDLIITQPHIEYRKQLGNQSQRFPKTIKQNITHLQLNFILYNIYGVQQIYILVFFCIFWHAF